jgi:hypothetical protein
MTDAPTLFDEPPTPRVVERERSSRADFLAGMIAAWRYGDSPTKPQKAAARDLAVEIDRRIRELA